MESCERNFSLVQVPEITVLLLTSSCVTHVTHRFPPFELVTRKPGPKLGSYPVKGSECHGAHFVLPVSYFSHLYLSFALIFSLC